MQGGKLCFALEDNHEITFKHVCSSSELNSNSQVPEIMRNVEM